MQGGSIAKCSIRYFFKMVHGPTKFENYCLKSEQDESWVTLWQFVKHEQILALKRPRESLDGR